LSFGIKNNPLTMFCIVKYSNASYNDELLDFEEFDCDDNHIEYVYIGNSSNCIDDLTFHKKDTENWENIKFTNIVDYIYKSGIRIFRFCPNSFLTKHRLKIIDLIK